MRDFPIRKIFLNDSKGANLKPLYGWNNLQPTTKTSEQPRPRCAEDEVDVCTNALKSFNINLISFLREHLKTKI